MWMIRVLAVCAALVLAYIVAQTVKVYVIAPAFEPDLAQTVSFYVSVVLGATFTQVAILWPLGR